MRALSIVPSRRHQATVRAPAEDAVVHAAQGEAAHVRRGVQVGDQRLQRRALLELGRGHALHEQVEQRLQVAALGRWSSDAQPALALAYTIGNSICDSSASRSRNSA